MSNTVPFIPVRPMPPASFPGPFRLLNMARKDLLAFWPENAYRFQFFGNKIINRWMFIANSPDTVEHVLVKNNDNYNRKSPYMLKALEPLIGDGLFISDGDTWTNRRALLAPAFTEKLQKFADIMTDSAAVMKEQWQEKYVDKEVLVLPEMAKLTAEILTRSMFGKAIGDEKATEVIDGFSEYQSLIEQFDWASFFGFPKWWPKMPTRRKVEELAKHVHSIVDEIIQQHIAEQKEEQCVLNMLLKASEDKSFGGMNLEQVRNEISVILMAGHETTANALSWTWYLLATHPKVEEKLHQELKQVLGGRAPTLQDVPKLNYARAVFDEALRLYPPVPILSRQAIGDDKIRNRDIPAGSIMIVIPWLLHRHRLLWEKPDEFIPERFTGEWSTKNDKYAYVPFSAGPRFCPGAAFGKIEAIISLATLAQQFTLRVKPGHKVSYDCRLTLRPGSGLPMILKNRS